jgi:hypothetical protein
MPTSPSRPQHLIEQHNLLGGIDVVRPAKARRATPVANVRHQDRVGFVAALALVVAIGKREEAEKDVPKQTRCPKCKKVGRTGVEFGVRKMADGELRAQSWCRACRASRAHGSRAPKSGLLFSLAS